MLTQKKIIELLRGEFPYLQEEFGVKKIALFGSFAKNLASSASDIDLVVEFQRPIGLKFIDLSEYLEKTLGAKADILTPEGIKGIRIKRISAAIRKSLLYV